MEVYTMKKIATVLLALLIMSIGVSAFSFDKHIVVKGDWEWTGCKWQKTYPTTATYDYSAVSASTVSSVNNYDNLGSPWKYVGQTIVSVNKAARFSDNLQAWTVNDPETTPATGGYTQFEFHKLTQIDDVNSASSVSVDLVGESAISYIGVVETDAESTDSTYVSINE
jgi:hypothetical protein